MQTQLSALESIKSRIEETFERLPLATYIHHYNNEKPRTIYGRNIDFESFQIQKEYCNSEDNLAKFGSEFANLVNETIYRALLADVEANSKNLSSTSDGVLSVNATSGFVEEKLDELLQNFEHYSGIVASDICIGVSFDELEELKQNEKLSVNSNRYVFEDGLLKYYFGAEFINISKKLFRCDHGMRTCFALGKGGVQVNWYLEETKDSIICYIGAVRTDGSRVQKLYTTSSLN